jgi:hypothetical protein
MLIYNKYLNTLSQQNKPGNNMTQVNAQVTDQVIDRVIARVNSRFHLIESLLEQLDEQSRLINDEITDEQDENGEAAGQARENVFLHMAANKGRDFGKWMLAERLKFRGELNGDLYYDDAPIFYSRGYEIAPGNKELMIADEIRLKFTNDILKN